MSKIVQGQKVEDDFKPAVSLHKTLRTQAVLTTTALAASATYTGESLDAIESKRISGLVYADQAGDLFIDHSDNGVNWYATPAKAVAAGAVVHFDEVVYARYVRIRYVNGITAQAAFRLVGYLNTL